MAGSLSAPVPETTTSAVRSPDDVSRRHTPASSSQFASSTSWSKRTCGVIPKRSAQSRR